MFLKSIINIADPLVHWTGESYASDNVYDEYQNYTLVNSGASLGEQGQANTNFSSKSINLKNGHLSVLDGYFLHTEISNRDFSIHFNFRADVPVVGTKAIIQKWDPEQVFWLGFENGDLTLHVVTDSGLVTGTFPYNKQYFSGEWNSVTFRVTSGNLRVYLNGYAGIDISNASPFQISTISQFTIGEPGSSEFTTDFYINDISITRHDNPYLPLAVFLFPRSDADVWRAMAPKYLFRVADYFKINPEYPIPNEGYAGDVYGYVKTDSTTEPYIVRPDSGDSREYVHIPAKGWFVIDDDIQLDISKNVTFVFDCGFDTPFSAGGAKFSSVFFDISENENNNIERAIASLEVYGSSQWLGVKLYDVNENVLFSKTSQDDSADGWDGAYGFRTLRLSHDNLYGRFYPRKYWYTYGAQPSYNFSGYLNTVSLKYNRFMYCSGTDGVTFSRIRTMAIFEYDLVHEWTKMLAYKRVILMQHFLQNDSRGLSLQFYGLENTTTPQLCDYVNNNNTMRYISASWQTSVVDSLANKQNELVECPYVGNGNYIMQDSYGDSNYVDTNDITINFFMRNKNTTSRKRVISYSYSPPYDGDSTGTLKFELWINSKNGQFSYGDIEVGWNNMASGYTGSTDSNIVVDDGFHMITFVRDGVENMLYIDGILRCKFVTPAVYNAGSNNSAWKFYGSEYYVSEFSYFRGFVPTQEYIEFIFRGYSDVVIGKTLLNGSPLPSRMLAIRHDNGSVVSSDYSDGNGKFEFQLPKDINHRALDIVALPQDETATNHIVVHGPYNAHTTYTRYVEEVFDESLKDMIIDMEPYAYYPLDDTSGTTAIDESGNSRNGTYTGGIVLDNEGPEPESKSAYFDGVDGFVDLPDGFDDFSNGLTIELFALPKSSKNWARFVELASADDGVDRILVSRHSTSSDLHVFIDSASDFTQNVSGVVENNLWKHFVLRVEPDSATTIFVNGKVMYSGTGALPTVIQRIKNYIGKSTFSTDSYYEGYMCHVAVYDYALPTEDVVKHSKRGFQMSHETLRSSILFTSPSAYWTFDRLKGLKDDVAEYTLQAYGSYLIQKNMLVINDGVVGNNYLHIPTSDYYLNMSGSNKWSIEFSIKVDATQTNAVVISEWDGTSNTGTYKIVLDGTNTFKVYVNDGSTVIQSSALYNDGNWHHVVVTYDGTLKLYVDNNLEASLDVTVSNYGMHDLTIGNDSAGDSSTSFESKVFLDDIALYDKLLSSVDAENHYNLFLNKKDTI